MTDRTVRNETHWRVETFEPESRIADFDCAREASDFLREKLAEGVEAYMWRISRTIDALGVWNETMERV